MYPKITAALLIPSQLSTSQGKKIPPSEKGYNCKTPPTLSGSIRNERMVIKGKNHRRHDGGGDEIVFSVDKFPKQSLMPKKKNFHKKKNQQNILSNHKNQIGNSHNPPNHSQKKKPKINRIGNIPDIHWRAISMDHLRLHPLFEPLPEEIDSIQTLEDVKRFRQDTWQWDALHRGRCTTSQAEAALGFLESKAAAELDIPRSLRNKQRSFEAYQRLQQPALRTIHDMNTVLLEQDPYNFTESAGKEENTEGVWQRINNEDSKSDRNGQDYYFQKKYPFAARYVPTLTQDELYKRKQRILKQPYKNSLQARMSWGTAQEPTAILTALNYLYNHVDRNIVVEEVGMCGASIQTDTDLLIGASPDAVIRYPNGTLEVLEVKNHCPFISFTGKNKKFSIRHFELEGTVPNVYIPQLMMEMYCLGDACRSALMVRQTATNGAIILRIHRNDAWIDEMMYWLQEFYSRYVIPQKPPEDNFFFDEPRYQQLLQSTKTDIQIDIVDTIPHSSIQRVLSSNKEFLPLFLD